VAAHNELGKQGEEIALKYLRGKGYHIRETNWRSGKNEIDIIAQDGKYLVIVEVKSRRSKYAGEPEVAVDRKKQKLLIRAANIYILRKNVRCETRFDIISIIITDEESVIHHIKDAFYPTL
jgi:putative endonuclease